MKKIIFLGAVCFVSAHIFPAYANPLSELNIQDFEKRSKESAPTLESPFVPKQTAKEEILVEDLKLSGVAIGDGESFALVSGNVLQLGDRIAGYRVKQISRDGVVLQRLDKRLVLRMEGSVQ